MSRLLKLSILAAMVIAVVSCSDDDSNNTNDTNVCDDNAKQCNDVGVPQVCEGGAWVDLAACSEGEHCGATGECVEVSPTCTDGAKQCSASGVPQLCTDGAWADQSACANLQTCTDGTCVGEPVCTNGARRCNDSGVPQLCAGGREWVDQAACTGEQTCTNGECVGESVCTDGAKKCSDAGVPQLCIDGAWADQTACTGGKTCTAGECADDGSPPVPGTPCDDTYVESCYNKMAYYCGSGKVKELDCPEDDGVCVVIEDDTAWCAYPDADWYDECTYDGEIVFWEDEYACEQYNEGVIFFDSCHMIDGTMYVLDDRSAESVCQNNNKMSCTNVTTIGSTSCGSGTCLFDGLEATCH